MINLAMGFQKLKSFEVDLPLPSFSVGSQMFLLKSEFQGSLGGQTFLPFRASPRAGSHGRAHPTRTESQTHMEQTTHTIGRPKEPNFPRN